MSDHPYLQTDMFQGTTRPILHLHRRDDRATSVEAATAIHKRVNVLQQKVLAFAKACGSKGFTDRDIERHFLTQGSTYRTRRTELTAQGLIVDTRETKTHGTNRKHTIWRIA